MKAVKALQQQRASSQSVCTKGRDVAGEED